MSQLTYKCGHVSHRADHRRGKVRAQIVAEVEATACPNCRLRERAAKYTHVDGQPYSAAEVEAHVAARIKRFI